MDPGPACNPNYYFITVDYFFVRDRAGINFGIRNLQMSCAPKINVEMVCCL